MAFWKSKAGWQAILILLAGMVAFAFGVIGDLNEAIHSFVAQHEDFQLDEALLALDIVGLMSIVYAVLRIMDYQRSGKQRDVAEAQAQWLAHHDALTGLLNRHALTRRLAAVESRAQEFGVILVDLDGFKKVNDFFGHAAGDHVLKTVADRIRLLVPEDCLYRFGGDEFVAVVHKDAKSIAERIITAIHEPISFNGISLDIGASAGFAVSPGDTRDAEECLLFADAAMYFAKAAGRAQVHAYDRSMQERQLIRAQAEQHLREALQRKMIRPYYQPIINLTTGQISGFEALARWEKAPGIFVPPCEFISIAEEAGLIDQLSEQLLGEACRDAAQWPNDIILSFNISPIQLRNKQLGLHILETLMAAGLPPHRLEIEVTETTLVQDLETANHVLSDLHAGGVRIALDDFGTGYSSLAHLSTFRFDKIKIDRSFVNSFQEQAKQEKIVKAIVGLGAGLEVSTTAEGVETQEQLQSLIQMGCTYGQGYLFGKAVPFEQANRLLHPAHKETMALAG